jgi:hypothetical protein
MVALDEEHPALPRPADADPLLAALQYRVKFGVASRQAHNQRSRFPATSGFAPMQPHEAIARIER